MHNINNIIKKLFYIACIVYFLPITLYAQQLSAIENIQQYAYGIPITTDGKEPFYQFVLPLSVYQNTKTDNFQDVALFNQKGKAVPFSLYVADKQKQTLQQHALQFTQYNNRFYPIYGSEIEEQKYRITIYQKNDTKAFFEQTVVFSKNEKPQNSVVYLLKLAEKTTNKIKINQLKILLEEDNFSGVINAQLYSIKTDQHCRLKNNYLGTVSNQDNTEHLKFDTLTLAADDFVCNQLDNDDTLALFLFTSEANTVPKMSKINAEYLTSETNIETIESTAKNISEENTDNTAVYKFDNSYSLRQLTIVPLLQDSIYPIKFYYKQTSQQKDWQLNSEINSIYNLTKQEFPISRFNLNDITVQEIKLVAKRGSWHNQPPLITASITPRSLLFNNPPSNNSFILAVGNPKASSQALNLQQLLPTEQLGKLDAIPTANIGSIEVINASQIAKKKIIPVNYLEYLYYGVIILLLGVVIYLVCKIQKDSLP